MQVGHLSAYQVARETIAAFQHALGEDQTLLPLQQEAVRLGLFSEPQEAGPNLLIAAPTSSGKSALSEMAAIHTAQIGQRVLYVVPLKAMAEETYTSLSTRYPGLDLKVRISTRDRREFDEAIVAADFHIAVLVYEKLQSLLVSRPELLSQVGLCLVDELQMLTDPGRGSALEVLLTKLKKGPRLICLSAPFSGLDEIGTWLNAQVLLSDRRPVELRKGILHRGRFTYVVDGDQVEEDDGTKEEDLYPDPGDKEGRDLRKQLLKVVTALHKRGEQSLVFLPDKARTVEAARDLCSTLESHGKSAKGAMDELYATDDGQARQALLSTLRRGVAFHNSDLTQAQREIVERAFRAGEVRVLCATSTLAMGVNLPARNVILAERWKWRYSRRYGKWIRDDMTKLEYEGMCGRAGRLLGGQKAFGRAILIAPCRFDQEVWHKTLVTAPLQALDPPLLGKPLGAVILDLVASGICKNEGDLCSFLFSTLTGQLRWQLRPGYDLFAESVKGTIADLIQNELLIFDQTLVATALGNLCARKGLAVRTALLLARWADAAMVPTAKITDLEVLLCLALTPDGGDAQIALTLPEHRFGDYYTRAILRATELGVADRRVFRWLTDQRGKLTYDQTKAVKKALLLLDWVDGQKSIELEHDHGVWTGAVSQAALDFAWLVESLAEVCESRCMLSSQVAQLWGLAERLRYGVNESVLPLARAAGQALGRSHLFRMAEAGLVNEEKLAEVRPETLDQALCHPSQGVLARIYQIQAALKARTQKEATAEGKQRASQEAPEVPRVGDGSMEGPAATLLARLPSLGINLRPVLQKPKKQPVQAPDKVVLSAELVGRKCFLRLGDKRVAISPASFALLTRLVVASSWVTVQSLFRNSIQARKAISRLRGELRRLDGEARSWLENDGRGNYRLSQAAPEIALDREALAKHPLQAIRAALVAA